MEHKHNLFRKKSIDKIQSIDDLEESIQIIQPSTLLIIAAISLLLIGLMIWGIMGTLETKVKSKIVVNQNVGQIYSDNIDEISIGDEVIYNEERIGVISQDNNSNIIVNIEKGKLKDGEYLCDVVVEKIAPISFLLN